MYNKRTQYISHARVVKESGGEEVRGRDKKLRRNSRSGWNFSRFLAPLEWQASFPRRDRAFLALTVVVSRIRWKLLGSPGGRPIDIGTIYNLESKGRTAFGNIGAGYKFVTTSWSVSALAIRRGNALCIQWAGDQATLPLSWSSWYFQRTRLRMLPRGRGFLDFSSFWF